MASNLVPQPNTSLASRQGFILPGAIARAGRKAQEGFLEFFFASIRNVNTREAYARAVRDFFAWCEERGAELDKISPLLIAAYIEKHPGSAPTVKQHLAALRMLFDYLVVKQVIPTNPAAAVKGSV
jgi:site-specific recombinase XerD